MPGINMMPSGSTLQIPLDACTNFSGKAGNAQVTLTWTDPKDKYATPEGETAQDPDQLVSVWEYTQIIRKTGSQPAGPHDGELVVSSSVRDQYATTGFVDTGLVNGTLYYYAAFAYNTDDVVSDGAFISATPVAGTPLSQLAEGTLIKILENGSPVEFYVAMQNYEAGLNGTGRVLCVRRPAHSQRQWTIYSGNDYNGSSIDSWLNSTYVGYFSENVKQMMGSTTIYYGVGTQGYQMTRSCFIMSTLELGYPGHGSMGSTLPIASVLQGSYSTDPSSYQWTRTPASSDGMARAASKNYGTVGMDCQDRNWIVPCFTLPSTALVDQDLNLVS